MKTDKSSQKVLVVMGSSSDCDKVIKCISILKEFNISYSVRVISAHRSSDIAIDVAKNAQEKGFSVIICAAGMAAHLAGVFAANTCLPVIGLPLSGGAISGLDALLSTVEMPSGIPVATVAIDGAKNAAYLAIEILALNNDGLKEKLVEHKKNMKETIISRDREVQERINKQLS